MEGKPLSLVGAPISTLALSRPNQLIACHREAKDLRSIVGIRKWPRDAHDIARRLGGRFTSMEEMECNDLMKYARRLDRSDGTDRAAIVLDFAAVCMTEVSPLLTNAGKRLAIGKVPTSRSGSKVSESSAALERIATGNQSDWRLISEALNAFRRMPKVRVFRRELLDEMHAILRGVQNQDFEDLAEATWAIRDRARHIGRRIDRRIISRTLLVKGLEFDGCVVLDPQELGNKELYVAMTRGASSLTVLTPDGIPEITYAAS